MGFVLLNKMLGFTTRRLYSVWSPNRPQQPCIWQESAGAMSPKQPTFPRHTSTKIWAALSPCTENSQIFGFLWNKTKQNWQLCPLILMQKCGCRLDKHSSETVPHWRAALMWWLVRTTDSWWQCRAPAAYTEADSEFWFICLIML